MAAGKRLYLGLRDKLRVFLANEDPFAAIANTGAFLVWSNQPLYPVYVWALVGKDAWPSLLTWLSTPFFFYVAILARTRPLASRVLFVIAGLANTLLSVKAFGAATSVGWFLVPCLIIATTFFRAREWKASGALSLATAVAGLLAPRLGAPLHSYNDSQARALSHLNLWSVGVLSACLLFAALRVRHRPHGGV